MVWYMSESCEKVSMPRFISHETVVEKINLEGFFSLETLPSKPYVKCRDQKIYPDVQRPNRNCCVHKTMRYETSSFSFMARQF